MNYEIEQQEPRPDYIKQIQAKSKALVVKEYIGDADCKRYITTDEAIKICEEALKANPVENRVIASEHTEGSFANGAVADVTHKLMDEQKAILAKANYTKNIIDGKINIDLTTQMELQNHFTKSMYEIFKIATTTP